MISDHCEERKGQINVDTIPFCLNFLQIFEINLKILSCKKCTRTKLQQIRTPAKHKHQPRSCISGIIWSPMLCSRAGLIWSPFPTTCQDEYQRSQRKDRAVHTPPMPGLPLPSLKQAPYLIWFTRFLYKFLGLVGSKNQ